MLIFYHLLQDLAFCHAVSLLTRRAGAQPLRKGQAGITERDKAHLCLPS